MPTQKPDPARTDSEYEELMKTAPAEVDFIRSMDDWTGRVNSRNDGPSPLKRLSEGQLEALTKGLLFNNGGLAGADFSPIIDTITVAEFEVLLNDFGMSSKLYEDHRGFRCDGLHTCVASDVHHICMSNC